MGYIVDSTSLGKVSRVLDTEGTNTAHDQAIIDNVVANGHHKIDDHHYYDATNFIEVEAATQEVEPIAVDLTDFTGYCVDSDLPESMFEESQWIKEDSEPEV